MRLNLKSEQISNNWTPFFFESSYEVAASKVLLFSICNKLDILEIARKLYVYANFGVMFVSWLERIVRNFRSI